MVPLKWIVYVERTEAATEAEAIGELVYSCGLDIARAIEIGSSRCSSFQTIESSIRDNANGFWLRNALPIADIWPYATQTAE